jgi:hypothetical protein
MTLED